MSDRILAPDAAATYLSAKFDRMIAAIGAGDRAAALAVVQEIRDDGFPAAADDVLDTLIAAIRAAEIPDTPTGPAPSGPAPSGA
jgi:hypothetical protein